MKIVISDIETNRLEDPDKLWLFGGIDYNTRERIKFEPFRGEKEKQEAIKWAESVDVWVGHRFIQFDAIQINRLLKPKLINPDKVIDTLICSRLLKYDIPVPKGASKPHSLDAWGIRLGRRKGDFSAFEEFSDEMVEYWWGDLDLTLDLFNHFKPMIYDPKWKKSLRVEHDLQIELERQKYYGFKFDTDKAKSLLSSIQSKMVDLEQELQDDFPPRLEVVKTLKYKLKKDGTESHHVTKAREDYALVKVDGEELNCYEYVPFNPGSPVDRIDRLWEAGWKPYGRTKTHQQFSRLRVGDYYSKSVPKLTKEIMEEKTKHFQRYGWVCNEDNLSTLPAKAPAGAKKLATWLTLEGRRSSLVEWVGQVKDDERIHGSVEGIGAWTGRCAHNNPNTANIAAGFHGDVVTAVDAVKHEYDEQLRALWCVGTNSWLVGCDAEGVQLRVLGDQIWRHVGEREYSDTIVSGRKEDETDIHNVNKRALGLSHISRDDAKRFIYSYVLNAGAPKVASILRTTIPNASLAKDNFENSIKGLKQFKNEVLPMIAAKGYFTGYDGRLVQVPSLHKTLAGILQNAEKVIMAHSMVSWTKELRSDGIKFKPLAFVHDEFEVEVVGSYEEAEYVKKVVSKAIVDAGVDLGFLTPLAASGSIGKSWNQVH